MSEFNFQSWISSLTTTELPEHTPDPLWQYEWLIVGALESHGLSLRLSTTEDNPTLLVSPRHRITPHLAQLIRLNRSFLVTFIQFRDDFIQSFIPDWAQADPVCLNYARDAARIATHDALHSPSGADYGAIAEEYTCLINSYLLD